MHPAHSLQYYASISPHEASNLLYIFRPAKALLYISPHAKYSAINRWPIDVGGGCAVKCRFFFVPHLLVGALTNELSPCNLLNSVH